MPQSFERNANDRAESPTQDGLALGQTVFDLLAQEFPPIDLSASQGPDRPPTQFPTRTETVVITDHD